MAKRVLVGVDGSSPSDEALAFAVEEWPDATFILLHVVNPVTAGYSAVGVGGTSEEWYEKERERAEELLASAGERVPANAVVETTVEVGRPSTVIVEVGKSEDADHLVVGSHGREGVSRILLGSVAETVVRRSPVPVTVVR